MGHSAAAHRGTQLTGGVCDGQSGLGVVRGREHDAPHSCVERAKRVVVVVVMAVVAAVVVMVAAVVVV